MNIRPLHDRVVVRRIEEKKTSPGGIVIPDSAIENPTQAYVVSVGKGTVNNKGEAIQLDVRPGDKVLFGKYNGTEIRINGEDLLVMHEKDIMGVIAAKS